MALGPQRPCLGFLDLGWIIFRAPFAAGAALNWKGLALGFGDPGAVADWIDGDMIAGLAKPELGAVCA